MELLIFIGIIGIFVGIYILPWICASIRNHENLPAIGVANLLLGWTFIGWVVCLVWAFKNSPGVNVSPISVNHGSKASTVDELERLAKLRDSGVLTEEEFQAQKEKTLR